jgi:hypothetical protein
VSHPGGCLSPGLWLQAHVEQVLFPALAPGVSVIMDNRKQPKERQRAHGHRGGRRDATLPAALELRTYTNRKRRLEIEGATAQSRRENRRRALG